MKGSFGGDLGLPARVFGSGSGPLVAATASADTDLGERLLHRQCSVDQAVGAVNVIW